MSSVEDEIMRTMAEEIAREIDKEIVDTIMIDVLTKEGWIVTDCSKESVIGSDWYADTAEWIHINATGDYKLLRGKWVFERREDAVLFTLKWS